MGRTGKLSDLLTKNTAAKNALGADASDEDVAAVMSKLGEDTVKTVQQAGQAIQSFRQFFKGSVTEVFDQVNGLLGTDVAGTFKGAESEMFMRLGATGLATGHTIQQMGGLAGMAHQYSSRNGNPKWGSAAAGTIAGQLLGVHRAIGGGGEFINSEQFTRDTVFEVEDAMHSSLATSIRGAYARVMTGAGGDARGDALNKALAANPIRSASDVATLTSGILGEDISSFSLDLWGQTPEARRLIWDDQRSGTFEAMQLVAMHEGDQQRKLFELALTREGGLTADAAAAVMKRTGGAMTIDALMGAIDGSGMGTTAIGDVAGLLHGRAAFGHQSSEARQAGIGMALNEASRKLITGNIGSNVQLMQLLSAKGGQGVAGFSAFLQEMKDDKGGAGSKSIIAQLLGVDETTVHPSDVAGFIGANAPMLKWLEEHGTDKEKQGLAIIWEGLSSGVGPGGGNVTSDQLKNFRTALASIGEGPMEEGDNYNVSGMTAIAEKYNGMAFDSDGKLIRPGSEASLLDGILKLLQRNLPKT